MGPACVLRQGRFSFIRCRFLVTRAPRFSDDAGAKRLTEPVSFASGRGADPQKSMRVTELTHGWTKLVPGVPGVRDTRPSHASDLARVGSKHFEIGFGAGLVPQACLLDFHPEGLTAHRGGSYGIAATWTELVR